MSDVRLNLVAEEGNRRKGGATYEEVKQCVLDIRSWFCRADRSFNDREGASSVDFQRMEKACDQSVPEGLQALLEVVNGGIWFMDKPLLSTEQIIRTVAELESAGGWRPTLIPFCGDESGYLVVNTRSNEVFEYEAGEGLGDSVDSTFTSHLEKYRDELLSGRFEYLDGIGVVEKVGAGARRK